MASKRTREAIGEEFSGFQFVDPRLVERAELIAARLARRPAASLPEAMRDEVGLEGTYRFLGNPRVTAEEILAPHHRNTVARAGRAAASGATLLVLHDTTECKFGGSYQRTGLGLLPNGTQGFLAHTSLVVATRNEVSDPLGVLGVQSWARTEPKVKKRGGHELAQALDSEGNRWWEGMVAAEQALGGPGSVIHVADREADKYRLIALADERGTRFIIRNKYDRRTYDEYAEAQPLREMVRRDDALILRREVGLAARHPAEKMQKSASGKKALKGASFIRGPASKKTHPSRATRIAELHTTAGVYLIKRPNSELPELEDHLPINVVRVFEPSPPSGAEAVEWFLLTNEPIETPQQVAAIVDAYRTRWLIEEFFKALKTGCSYESRQLESFDSLEKILAFSCAIAWRMLRMRTLARTAEGASASEVLTPAQIFLLRREVPKRMPANPTALDALLAVASLGGHLKNNGPPGWLVLQRGFDELLTMERGLMTLFGSQTCDQS